MFSFNGPGSTMYSGDITTDRDGATTIIITRTIQKVDTSYSFDLPKKKTKNSEELFIESLNLKDDPPSDVIIKPKPIFKTNREMSRQGQFLLNKRNKE